MKQIISYILLLFIPLVVIAQEKHSSEKITQAIENKKLSINAQKKWLLLPVKNGVKKQKVQIRSQGQEIRSFEIELASEEPDWYAYLDISNWKGKKLEIGADSNRDNAKFFSLIKQSEKELDSAMLYSEKKRGQFHFSPKRGWNNDPNGLVYYKGEYHLFFQHNPYGILWGNMHWGHAVSKDLVHWKEIGEALYPDSYGPMFSGGGVVDENNTSGFGDNSNAPMVVFYTAADAWSQGLAYSNDGRKFEKIDPVVPKITDGNRDPKVIWYEPTKKWIMILYVEKENKQHTMHFFTSSNLKDWELASVVKGGIGDDGYLFECPEFFQLPIEGNPQKKKWILMAANSEYAIGIFDGKVFTPEIERLNGQHGRDYYAAQTFNNEPKGRRVEIGWWRTHTQQDGNSFNQSMSIPMQLKLLQTPKGPRLARTPVEELKSLRKKRHSFKDISLQNSQTVPLKDINAELLEIRATLMPHQADTVQFNIRGIKMAYYVKEEKLSIDGVDAHLPMTDKKLNLTVYVDRTGLEVFANEGLFFMPINVNINNKNKDLDLSVKGGNVQFPEIDVYELESAWK